MYRSWIEKDHGWMGGRGGGGGGGEFQGRVLFGFLSSVLRNFGEVGEEEGRVREKNRGGPPACNVYIYIYSLVFRRTVKNTLKRYIYIYF